MRHATARLCVAAILLGFLGGAARQSFAATDQQLVRDARETIGLYRQTDPGIDRFIQHAAGFAVFPGVGKGGYWVGGAHGTGVLFEGGLPTGRATLTQVTVGPQAGGQEYSEVIFFETPRALAEFKRGKAAFTAQASAVALSSGAAQVAKYERGVAIFTSMRGGLMVEATVGGQKFGYEPFALHH
jgi:lipid-binding SYLF domain-containing protein